MKIFNFLRRLTDSIFKRAPQRHGGFTLLEMVIAIGIFSVLVIAAVGIIIQVSSARRKVTNTQSVQDNIRYGLELITKEMRTGTNYALTARGNACGGTASIQNPSEVSFTTAAGDTRIYYLNSATQTIMRMVGTNDCSNASPLTSDEVAVDRLQFSLRGATPGPSDGQAMATIALTIRSRDLKQILESSMNLETTVVERLREL